MAAGGNSISGDSRAVLAVRVLFDDIAKGQAAACFIESQITNALAIECSIEEV